MFLVNVAAVADNTSTPPPSNDLRHRLYLGRTQLVEAASDIDGTTYLLEIQLTSRKPTNVPSTIKVKVGSEEFEVPHTWFDKEYGVSATTHLFRLETGEIAFVLFCGDGEHAKHRVFRIDVKNHVIKWQDWTPFGKFEGESNYQRIQSKHGKK
jgi:hypothetical protein